MAANGPGWCDACHDDYGDSNSLRTHLTSAKHASAADAFRRGFDAGWLAALSNEAVEKADEQMTQDSTVAIVSRFSPLQDDQEDDTGHCTILPSDVAPTEASKTQDDDLALMDGSTSEPAAYCRTTVKDFNVAVLQEESFYFIVCYGL
jgi:hypothetical protein